jgi:hypothetical protein
MAGKPLWRRAYDTVERPVAVRLEDAVQTDLFADVAGLLVRTRADVSRRFERTTRHAWHRINLPAASDVARLRDQVVALDRSVRRLDDAVRRTALAQAATTAQTNTAGGPDGTVDGPGRPGGKGAPRRRTQPVQGAKRREVRDRDRPAAGRADTEGRRLAP